MGELSGEVEHFERIFAAVEALSPVPVEYRPAQKSKGCYSHLEQKIYLNQGMSQVQTLKNADSRDGPRPAPCPAGSGGQRQTHQGGGG